MNVVVVMSGDEEEAGDPLAQASEDLVETAARATPRSASRTGPAIRRKPSTRAPRRDRLDAPRHGRPAHSSQIFREDVGDGAIFEAARILDAFAGRLPANRI